MDACTNCEARWFLWRVLCNAVINTIARDGTVNQTVDWTVRGDVSDAVERTVYRTAEQDPACSVLPDFLLDAKVEV